ncbi:hypothetical protein [Kangiella spongicola]|jgi:hypothetical protein|uniref:Uncharacterized protein n=1 Tax=Kangiella spongicola TaxID=796379 RepID=A0A318D4A4_9GAMM|nr:hypothetical protein [Kangiella spongicola]MBV34535.1 hypothetical protein [Rickettsiales bacterium]PXF63781.1 hypothetical protein DL796_01125 [Kangiella spongicola]
MAKITILAGDFPRGTGYFTFRNLTLPGDENHYLCETVSINQIEFINTANPKMALLLNKDKALAEEIQLELEEKIRLADENDVIFMVRLSDERRFIAEADSATFHKIKSSVANLKNTNSSYIGNSA